MSRQLTLDESWTLTENFALCPVAERNPDSTLPVTDLIEEEVCLEKLNRVMEVCGYPNLKVTASTFTKRYSIHTAAAALFAMSVLNVKLNFKAENCWADLDFVGAPGRTRVPLEDWTCEDLPDAMDPEARHAAIDKLIRELFAEHLTPLFGTLKATSKVNAQILWENMAERVYPIYERQMDDISLEALVRLKTDFDYLMNGIAPETFGLDFNPFKKFDIHDEYGYRTRKTCCLRYQVSCYCRNCPLRHKQH